ncbi:uncharacterized protein LOC132943317 [Metopolophium dirhodum]|uniref:uncharacterized protein LOC132943317 n=1 Tax=Metopolophium dirhodum TaxID=44670 RepID=UPI00298FF6E6|nr:uncharacterized protein LOC132943317 [Metopolophium dirhodum]
MTTIFHITLRSILIISKCMGLIDISYTLGPAGLFVRDINSTFYVFLEIARMIALVICTYLYFHQFDPDFHIFQYISVFKFWIVIIGARVSTIWIIKFINGIIEFDRKIIPISTNLLITQHSLKEKQWDRILISFIVYLIGFKSVQVYLYPMKKVNITSLIQSLVFSPPYVMDATVTITSCFFLQNLYVRFQTIIDFWKCLPTELAAVPGQWTHTEIVVLMENTRLLHSELCELLKTFTQGYGPLLLGFYTFSYISMLVSVYFIVNNDPLSSANTAEKFRVVIPLVIHVQMFSFLVSIIVFVSFINEKRIEMISYLRLYQISNLHLDIKRQIKMFMNQIPAYEFDRISAFGFFDINLKLVTSMIVLLITGISTMVQMKDHPIILQLNNNTKLFLIKLFKTSRIKSN